MRSPESFRNGRACLFALAGLLHDAGKAFEASDVPLEDRQRAMERLLCPTDRTGRPTHRHVLWTAALLDRLEQRWNPGGLDHSLLYGLACYHHRPRPDHPDDALMVHADRIASGHDRRKLDTAEEPAPVFGLRPLLARVQLPDRSTGDQGFVLPLCAMSLDDRFLPGAAPDRQGYRERLRSLHAAINSAFCIRADDPYDAVEQALAVSHRLFHAIPSSRTRTEIPDTSLHDHGRVVAAFAACLAIQYPTTPSRPLEGAYRIVSFSLGGIQRFLFRSLPSVDSTGGSQKGLAKRLRARSFLISLLTHLVARRLLDATGLPLTNLLVEAGGHGMILLPDEPETIARIKVASAYCRRWFVERLGGSLRLDLGVTRRLTDADFASDRFGSTLEQARTVPERSRLRPPTDDLRDGVRWSDDPTRWVLKRPGLPVDDPDWLDRLAAFGGRLVRSDAIAIREGGAAEDRHEHELALLGWFVRPVADDDRRFAEERVLALGLDGDDAAISTLPAARHVPRWPAGLTSDERDRIVGSLEEELEEGDPLPFNSIAMLGRDDDGVPSGGRPMIGALKADVDRLGELMRLGFGGDASLGRLAGLSRTLDLFFKGYLDRRIASRYPHVYTVYAGGDDLMLIGPWFDLMRLALDLRSRLDDASCHNPSITLSAGLVVAGANTPIRSLAAAADRALDAAKEAANGARDRFCVFSSVLSWAVARDALAASRDLLTCVDEGSLPPSRLYRLLRHGRAAEAAAHAVASGRSVPIDQLSWRSKLSYDLRRLRDASAALDAVRVRLQQRDFIESGGLAVAVSTALYRLRTHKEIFA